MIGGIAMNDLQIEYFLAAAENLSFTKTANEKYVSQPAVSKQISALEEELGVSLFERGYKSTKLTAAGHTFASFFKKQKEDMELLAKDARESGKNDALSLRIGCGSGWQMADVLPEIIRRLKTREGDVRFWLESYEFNQIAPALNDGDIDLGITLHGAVVKLPSLEERILIKIPQMILYSPKHPLAEKEELKPEDFKNELFLVPRSNRSAYIIDLVNGFCEPYGFTPQIHEVKNTESMFINVLGGTGVAITDLWAWQTVKDHCLALPLKSVYTISSVWRRDNPNPLLPVFLKELTEKFQYE